MWKRGKRSRSNSSTLQALLGEERRDGRPAGPAADDDDVWLIHVSDARGAMGEARLTDGLRRLATSAGDVRRLH